MNLEKKHFFNYNTKPFSFPLSVVSYLTVSRFIPPSHSERSGFISVVSVMIRQANKTSVSCTMPFNHGKHLHEKSLVLFLYFLLLLLCVGSIKSVV